MCHNAWWEAFKLCLLKVFLRTTFWTKGDFTAKKVEKNCFSKWNLYRHRYRHRYRYRYRYRYRKSITHRCNRHLRHLRGSLPLPLRILPTAVRWASRVTLPSRSLTWRTRWTGSCWTWGRSRCRRRRSCRGNSGWRSTLPQNLKLNENIIVVLVQSRPLIVIMVNVIN